MTWMKTLGFAVPLTLGLWANAGDSFACGGCFVPPDENTQVTGHRMVMSIGKDQSTLYDQIEYSGSPESFAWVLPTKGQVEIGVSSDLVFNQLGFDSAVAVYPPPLDCPSYNCGYEEGPSFGSATSAGGGADNAGGGVDVIAQEVVGPYETVQLAATDPEALATWLEEHGYNLPKDIEPLVGTYVKEGFNFLAVKLVPGEGVQSMKPIRITTKGSAVALPLRMVAAGTGALTTITLYVLGEGRWDTANFPGFSLNPSDVVWDYGQDRSNYTELRAAEYAKTKGYGWQTESAQPYSVFGFRNNIENVFSFRGPEQSGYGTSEDYDKANAAMKEDLDTLFSGMDENSVWLTRLRAELPREALANDLVLGAATAQTNIDRFIQTTKFIGEQPSCPPPPPGCEEVGGGTDDLDVGVSARGGAGCSMGTAGLGDAAFGGALALVGVALYRRRRQAR